MANAMLLVRPLCNSSDTKKKSKKGIRNGNAFRRVGVPWVLPVHHAEACVGAHKAGRVCPLIWHQIIVQLAKGHTASNKSLAAVSKAIGKVDWRRKLGNCLGCFDRRDWSAETDNWYRCSCGSGGRLRR